MSMSKFSADPLEIEVKDREVYHKLLRETRNKRDFLNHRNNLYAIDYSSNCANPCR